jgi:DNA (cytosine-5)-methyltransferase 1
VSRPVLLDLFCGAGGASRGYTDAGFLTIGVDIEPQPNYPYEFVQADALDVLAGLLDGHLMDGLPERIDAIHASPPCQDWSALHRNYGAPEHGTGYLLHATLEALRQQDRPWVVENVVGAPLPTAFVLCGASFGLGASGLDLNRHRQFETSFGMLAPPCMHRRGQTIGVYGNGTNSWHRQKLGRNLTVAEMREAMGIDWTTREELTQAIPPAYTRFIGEQLLAHLGAEVAS